jgi:hypothetical protein
MTEQEKVEGEVKPKPLVIAIATVTDDRAIDRETLQFRSYSDDDGFPTTPAAPIDTVEYPMVVLGSEHWNALQRVMDETGTREQFRAVRAIVTPVRSGAIRLLADDEEIFIDKVEQAEEGEDKS